MLAAWPGLNEKGRAGPATAKPMPDTVIALTVTEDVPVDCRVTDRVETEFRVTAPKSRLAALTVRVRVR